MKHLKIQSQTKSSFVIITVFTLLLFISCSPSRQDSKQTKEEPELPSNQEQPTPAITEPVQPAENEPVETTESEQNNAEVMLNPPHGEPLVHRLTPLRQILPGKPPVIRFRLLRRKIPIRRPILQITQPLQHWRMPCG